MCISRYGKIKKHMVFKILVILTSLLAFLPSTEANIEPVWSKSQLIKSGKFNFQSQNSSVSHTGRIVYDIPMTDNQKIGYRNVALGISDLMYHFDGVEIQYQIQSYEATATGFNFKLLYNSNATPSFLSFSYLTVDKSIKNTFINIGLSFQSLMLQQQIGYFEQFKNEKQNLNNQRAILRLNNYLSAQAIGQQQKLFSFSFDHSQNILNQSQMLLQIKLPSIVIKQSRYDIVTINKTSMQTIGFNIFNQKYSLKSSQSLKLQIQYAELGNFFVGLSFFSVYSSNFMFKPHSMHNNFQISFQYVIFVWKACPQNSPVSKIIQDKQICYQQCGEGFFEINVAEIKRVCERCNQTCQECSNFNVCTKCSDFNNRILQGESCIAKFGFFQSGKAYAPACPIECLSCSSQYNCTTCQIGYQLSSTNSCKWTTKKMLSRQLETSDQCDADQYLYDNDCERCGLVLPNCLSCLNKLTCTKCNGTALAFLMPNNVCRTCSQIFINCLSCSSPSACAVCKSGYKVNPGVGNCITSGCPVGCLTCASTTCYSCLNGYYISSATCKPCMASCRTCTNGVSCNSCNSSYMLNAGNCVLNPCSVPNCDICESSDLSSCANCSLGYILSSQKLCQAGACNVPNCDICESSDPSLCANCQLGYQISSQKLCQEITACSVLNCDICESSDPSSCANCSLGYQISSQKLCQSRCGDGIRVAYEQCDDGNQDSMDGCSEQCEIEEGFECDLPAPPAIQLSSCTYTKPIDFNVNFIEKVQGANQVKVQISISPRLKAFKNLNFSSLISSNLPASNYTFEYIQQTGTLSMVVNYQDSIQGMQAIVTITPPNSGIFRLTPPSSQKIILNSRENSGLFLYNEQTYSLAAAVNIISTVLTYLAWLFFIMGMLAGKMIAVQMLAVFQICSLGLMTLKNTNPTLSALRNIFTSNGFNQFAVSNPYSLQELPNQIQGIGLDHQFLNDFNISFGLLAIPLIIGLIAFALSKTLYNQNAHKQRLMQKIYGSSIGEYTFLILIVSSYLIAVSITLEFSYGIKQLEQVIGYISIPQSILVLAVLIVYFILLLLKPQIFGEFKAQFDPNSKLSYFTYNYMIVQRIFIGIFLSTLYFVPQSLLFPMIVFLVQGVFFIAKKPYNKVRHCYRMVANNLISITVLSIYLYYGVDPLNSATSTAGIYLPIVVLLLLFICILLNAVFIIHSFVKWVKLQCQRTKDEQNDNEKGFDLQMSKVQALNLEHRRQMQDFQPSPLRQLRQQNDNSMVPKVQKLQNKNSDDELVQIQMDFNISEAFRQDQSLQGKNEQQNQKNNNILKTLEQIKKKNADIKFIQGQYHKTNLLEYEDI